MMQPRHKRLIFILLIAAGLSIALALALTGLRQNVTYFFTPTQVLEQRITLLQEKKHFRLGGMVEKGSVKKKDMDIYFTVSDLKNRLKVHYRGLPPDLFREGQGVVAEGVLDKSGRFEADMLLAKHDEKYMPPEIKKSMGK